jgi:photosystem II stability/assembly factor-like uncharacterized protein
MDASSMTPRGLRRRDLLAGAATWAACGAAWSGPAGNRTAQRFPALQQPALRTAKAAGAAMLASAKAGDRLVCVGERGIVIVSDDRGATWRQAAVPVAVTLTGVRFVTPAHGWCVGHLGVVLHTQDGGSTWAKQLDGLQLAERIAAVAADPESKLGDEARARVAAQAKMLLADGPDKPFFDLDFQNEREGVVVGAYNLAMRTSDGGRSWLPWSQDIDNPKGLHLYALCRKGSDLFGVGEQGTLVRRTIDGAKMALLSAPYQGTLFGMTTTRSGALQVFGLRGKSFVSDDNAATWREAVTGVTSSISGGVGLDDGRVVLATQAGDLLISEDGGRSFKRKAMPEPLPVTGLTPLGSGSLLATTLRGVRRLDIA